MKPARPRRSAPSGPPGRSHVRVAHVAAKRAGLAGETEELARLRARLANAEGTLRAIRAGDVDAVVVAGKTGPQVFTLQGAEHAYRVLIESMNEGALTLMADKMILYANRRFARMVKYPLEQVVGSSISRFLSAADRASLRPLLQRSGSSGAKIQVLLRAGDGSQLPAQISIRPVAVNGVNHAIIGMVVTDMTEARRNEEMLRTLSHRLVQSQEVERGRVALELHDKITQLLCAVLFRSQALADKLSARGGPLRKEAIKLREMLGTTAEDVERISRDLRPSVLDELGLAAALRHTSTEFAERTGVPVKLVCGPMTARLPADIELALYRILQQALMNVETHAHAHHVAVKLTLRGALVQLAIKDDGLGFDPERRAAGRNGQHGIGLLGMRERAASLGGALRIKSAPKAGTEIVVRIPVTRAAASRKTGRYQTTRRMAHPAQTPGT